MFLALEEAQSNIVLSGTVWLGETFYTVRAGGIARKDNGDKLRGLPKNQICIGVATDKKHTVFFVQGYGKPSQRNTFETFKNHIKPNSTLIHDGETAHNKLIKELELKSIAYDSKELEGLPDAKNPMNPVNRAHDIMKKFLNAHSGSNRDDMQNYLNLFSFVTNPPKDLLEKVEALIDLAFLNPKSLRYREFYNVNKEL